MLLLSDEDDEMVEQDDASVRDDAVLLRRCNILL
jgi:hypothetical protein